MCDKGLGMDPVKTTFGPDVSDGKGMLKSPRTLSRVFWANACFASLFIAMMALRTSSRSVLREFETGE